MEKRRIVKMPEKNTKSVISLLLIVLLTSFMCLLSIIGGNHEEVSNDDIFRNLVSVGAFGDDYSYYIPYSNVIFGIPIVLMNYLFPDINWYYLFFIVLDVVCISYMSYLIAEKRNLVETVFICSGFNLFLCRDFYLAIQYTKSAFLWTIVGAVVCFRSFYRGKKRCVLGFLLLLYGSSVRVQCLVMVFPFLMLFLLCFAWNEHRNEKLVSKWLKQSIISLGAVIVIIVGTEAGFRAFNPEWDEFWKYDRASQKIRDYMEIDYNNNPIEYDLIKSDYNDMELFKTWLWGDTDFYTYDWLVRVAEIEEKSNNMGLRMDVDILGKTARKIYESFEGLPVMSKGVAILAFLLVLLIFIKGNIVFRLYSIGNLIGIYFAYWYFTCKGRLLWRAEIGVYIAVIGMSVFLLSEKMVVQTTTAKTVKVTIIGLAAIIIVGSFSCYMAYNWRYVKDKQIIGEGDITGKMQTYNDEVDSFYLLTDFFVTSNPIAITRAKYKYIYKNAAYLGGWLIPSPTGMYYARQHGITNPMRALTQDGVYLDTSNEGVVEMIRKHLTKVLNREVRAKCVKDGVWKMVY